MKKLYVEPNVTIMTIKCEDIILVSNIEIEAKDELGGNVDEVL